MDYSDVCRTCLKTDALNPIFVNFHDNLRYSLAVFTVTGCKVTEDDGLSQLMCTSCINFINKSMRFRKTCKETESYLLEQLSINKVETFEESSKLRNTVSENGRSIFNSDLLKPEIELDNVKCEQKINKVVLETDTIEDVDDEKPLKYLLEPDSDHSDSHSSHTIILEIKDALNPEKVTKEQNMLETKGTVSENQGILELPYEVDFHSTHKTDTFSLDPTKVTKCEEGIVKGKKHALSENRQDVEVPYEVDYHSEAKTTRVTCKICYQSLSIRSIDAHMAMRHPGMDHRKIQCDLCDKYLLKGKMKRHKMMMHGITEQEATCFRCVYCKTKFENKEGLVEHVTECAGKKKKRKTNETSREMADCEECGKTMQKASLRMHLMIKHFGLGPVCEHCGKRFGSKFRLDEHYRAKHGYEKFKCAHCDFRSASVLAMRNHERRHRGEKPFVCEACGSKFHAAYLLAQHKQSHRTERLLKCDQCSATFKANNSLHMHKSTCHSGSLYACTMCSRTYSCRHYVVKHLRHFHQYRGAVGPLPRQDKPRRAAEESTPSR